MGSQKIKEVEIKMPDGKWGTMSLDELAEYLWPPTDCSTCATIFLDWEILKH